MKVIRLRRAKVLTRCAAAVSLSRGEMERGLSIVILVVSRFTPTSFPIASGQELLLKGAGNQLTAGWGWADVAG
jgi:hypothetical protein